MGKIIAFDFDGTVCENKFPEIGTEKKDIVEALKQEKTEGAELILWTCREGDLLDAAVDWLEDHGITPDAVNENIQSTIDSFGTDPRKVYADEYWDDRGKDLAAITELQNYVGAITRGRGKR